MEMAKKDKNYTKTNYSEKVKQLLVERQERILMKASLSALWNTHLWELGHK